MLFTMHFEQSGIFYRILRMFGSYRSNILSKEGRGFVDSEVLLTLRFCRHRDFVDAEILSSPNFCRHLTFVDAKILLAPIFS
jgi:hypothetical protein